MKILKILLAMIVTFTLLYFYNYNQIRVFRTRNIKLESDKIKNTFKITQISDFHSNSLIDLEKIEIEIKNFNPDFIVLTGDMIDYKDTELRTIIKLLKTVVKVDKPVYFVRGNHETNHILYDDLRKEMERLGINVLENDTRTITVSNEKINLTGLSFMPKSTGHEEGENYREIIEVLDLDYYNILLIHSPNNIEALLDGQEDLILSGHAHGGQFRLPIIGAIVAPGQGIFPKYDKGIFKINNSILHIDSGLGNSVAPIRAFNPVQFSNITIVPKE